MTEPLSDESTPAETAEAELEVEPTLDLEPEPEPESETESASEAESESEPEPETEPEPEPEPEPTWTRYDVSDPEQLDAGLKAAAAAIRAGECIVLPTDTVYGIGSKAQDAAAVQRLLDAKQRGRDMPPPVLISDAAMAGALVEDMPEYAEALALAFWPGALTLILTAQSGLGMDLGDTNGTIAVRVPDHDFARTLLRRTGPLAVSSANVSGQPASTTIDEAIAMLGNTVSVYLDAGPTPGNASSSMVDFTVSTAGEMVREGALDQGRLLAYAPLLKWHGGTPDEPEAEEPEPTDELETTDELESAGADEQTDEVESPGLPVSEPTPDPEPTPDVEAGARD